MEILMYVFILLVIFFFFNNLNVIRQYDIRLILRTCTCMYTYTGYSATGIQKLKKSFYKSKQ